VAAVAAVRASRLSFSGRGRQLWWAAAGLVQGHPLVFVVPAFGQVHGDMTTATGGDPAGYLDQMIADGGPAGFRVERAGQAAGGAQQVARDRGQGQPGRIRRETPDGR
jgi:hypothetical protein